MTVLHRIVLVLIFAFFIIPELHAQTWSDSLSKEERFWSRSGGEARELSLGAGGFGMLGDSGIKTLRTNPFSIDPVFMLQNPAYGPHYAGYLWFDDGVAGNATDGGTGQSFGGSFALSNNVTGGIVLARTDATGFSLVNPNIFGELSSLSGNFSYAPPTNTWQIMGSVLEGETSIGLALSYASSSATVTSGISNDSGVNTSSSRQANFHQIGLSAGALWRSDNGTMLDLGATALLPTLSSSASGSGAISMHAIGINGRLFLPLHDEFYLVPIVNAYFATGTSTFLATPKDLPSSQNYDAGIGVNFWQGGIHIMSGVTFGYYKQTTPAIASITPELSKTQTIVPRWTIGAEWPILRWLTARLGYFASSASETDVVLASPTTTQSVTNGSANLYSPLYGSTSSGLTAGATFQIARFNLDLTINDEMFRSGPANIFSGSAFGFVTMGYRFE